MSKILINQTSFALEITDVGVTIQPNTSYTIDPQDYMRFAASSNTIKGLASGALKLNDGGNDAQNLSDAVDILKGWCRQ